MKILQSLYNIDEKEWEYIVLYALSQVASVVVIWLLPTLFFSITGVAYNAAVLERLLPVVLVLFGLFINSRNHEAVFHRVVENGTSTLPLSQPIIEALGVAALVVYIVAV